MILNYVFVAFSRLLIQSFFLALFMSIYICKECLASQFLLQFIPICFFIFVAVFVRCENVLCFFFTIFKSSTFSMLSA